MHKYKSIIYILLILSCVTCSYPLSQSSGVEEQAKKGDTINIGDFTYIIGPADVLEVSVWRHPDLTTQAVVRPDGRIAFPLIDEIYACNITPEALKKEITIRLSKIIQEPKVTVNVVSFQSKKIFVIGEVGRPGVYPFDGNEGIFEAISKAGGYTRDTAALRSVMLIKGGNSPKQKVIKANILNLIQKADLSQNYKLEAGDIVYVPKTLISDIDKFIDQFFAQTDPVLKYYLDLYDVRNPSRRWGGL